MNYQQALDYIYSFADQGFKHHTQTYGLTRMRTLLARLGDPQRLLPVAHIAGTKGKGSTSAMIASIMQAAGYRVGLYTSPHLHETYERMRLNNVPISAEELAALTSELRPLFDSFAEVTTFEILTVLALVWLARQRCELAVIETGLGGRLDATNVLLPNVCAITSISFDHIAQLGSTLSDIASHKAGIIKAGAPTVTAPQPPEAEEAIAATARKRGSNLIRVGSDWRYHRESFGLAGQEFSIVNESAPARHYHLPLLGEHQIENATVALACAFELSKQGFKISDEALQQGLAQVQWAGRFEVMEGVVLDCAHNRDSVRRLVLTFKELFPQVKPRVIFGASDDKDVVGMLQELATVMEELVIVKSSHPHASNLEKLAALAESLGVARSVKVHHTISHALNEARQQAEMVLVTGSVFVVADVRAELKL